MWKLTLVCNHNFMACYLWLAEILASSCNEVCTCPIRRLDPTPAGCAMTPYPPPSDFPYKYQSTMIVPLAAKKLKKKFSVFILNQKHTIFRVWKRLYVFHSARIYSRILTVVPITGSGIIAMKAPNLPRTPQSIRITPKTCQINLLPTWQLKEDKSVCYYDSQ